MGSHEATCKPSVVAVAVIGLLKGGKPDAKTKANTYALVSEAAERFESICGSLVCQDILGDETGVVLYFCDGCVQQAVRITCNLLELTIGTNTYPEEDHLWQSVDYVRFCILSHRPFSSRK